MAWIRIVGEGEASGDLAREYEEARARAGRVWNILKIMSLNPGVLRQSMGLYKLLMRGPSALGRAQREMLAVVVSKVNDCHY